MNKKFNIEKARPKAIKIILSLMGDTQ